MSRIFDTEVSLTLNKTKTTRQITRDNMKKKDFDNPHVIEADAEKDNTLMVGALFKGKRRIEADIIEHTLITIDIDKGTWANFTDARDTLVKAGIDFLYHTTVSHTKEKPRFRIFIAMDKPVTPIQYAPLSRRIVRILKIPADRCSYVNNQGMYMPLVRVGSLSEYEWEYFPGTPLDIDKHIAAIPEEEFVVNKDSDQTYNPMTIPKGISEPVWMAAIARAYPANEVNEYDDWMQMGMAIYHQTNGNGFNYWLEWSRESDKHGEKISETEMRETKWKSFHISGRKRGITMRTILNKNPQVLGKAYSIAMDTVEDNESLDKLCTSISEDNFLQKQSKGIAATKLKTVHAKLNNGVKLQRGEAMEKLSPIQSEEDRSWADEWYYCGFDKLMYNVHNIDNPIDRDYFNVQFTKLMPANNNGIKPKAFDALMGNRNGYEMQFIDSTKFAAGKEVIFDENGKTFMNTFKQPPKLTSGEFGEHAIDSTISEYINKHYTALAGERPEVIHYMQQHMAWLRRHPDRRIHIGLAVTSKLTGIGKSTLKDIYSIVLGSRNVNAASNTELNDTFNEWASDPFMVTFFEEISLRGAALRKAMERMKEYITEDEIAIRGMQKSAKKKHCSTCYVVFSNYTEVLGHEGSDRRWSAITCPYEYQDQLEEVFGMSKEEFYTSYRKLMRNYPDRFIAYFESIDLNGFKTEVPLMTEEKKEYSDADPEVVFSKALESIIVDSENEFINKDLVVYQSITKSIKNYVSFNTDIDDNLDPYVHRSYGRTTLIKDALRVMGYRPLKMDSEWAPRLGPDKMKVRWNTIWVKPDSDWKSLLGIDNEITELSKQMEQI